MKMLNQPLGWATAYENSDILPIKRGVKKALRIVIHERLKQVPDYRTGNAIRHVLSDILMIGLLTIICNGNEFSFHIRLPC